MIEISIWGAAALFVMGMVTGLILEWLSVRRPPRNAPSAPQSAQRRLGEGLPPGMPLTGPVGHAGQAKAETDPKVVGILLGMPPGTKWPPQ